MKIKKVIAIIMALALLCSLAACGGQQGDGSSNGIYTPSPLGTSPSYTDDQVNDLVNEFKPPAELYTIDTSKSDPSDSNIRFVFDSEDRISKCYYKIGDLEVYQGYTYKDGRVQIYSFNKSTLIGDVSYEYSSAPSTGFIQQDGYYFKNVTVK